MINCLVWLNEGELENQSDMTTPKNKTAIVSGGGSGIGAAIAFSLANSGVSVVIVGRNESRLTDISKQHSSISHIVCDVTDEIAVNTVVCETAPDIIVANAGIAASKPFSKMSAGDLEDMLQVNLVGVFNIWRAALPGLVDKNWGRMIAIASTAGLKGYPYISGYCAAKHGVIGLTRALASELVKTAITVNAVCPGYVETPMLKGVLDNISSKTNMPIDQVEQMLKKINPQNRFIQPEEVSAAVLWLCSSLSGSVTGQTISISGGEV